MLVNSENSASLRNTLINQVQGAGISTLQQKKNWLIDWYFCNDPMSSIYLATLRNPALVSTYQTNPGMLYGTPFATGMENYFQKIKNYFGQSMFDQLVTELSQQSNLYVDEIKVDEYCIYGSSRLGVYEANKTISRRVARDINNDNQIGNNEYAVETPEEVLYLYSSYQLERGAKRYELSNHLGNVLTVISDKKTANFTGSTFTHFTAERISATDYSPFGAPLAGRTWQAQEYRFGFNSMEKENEINGIGNAYDFGARIYDARLGRWLSVDPLWVNSPYESHYSFVSNSPLLYSDEDGEVKRVRIFNVYLDEEGRIIKTEYSLHKVVSDELICKVSIKQIVIMGITFKYKVFDWYDIEEVNINYLQLKPGQSASQAKFLDSKNLVFRGKHRTNTLLKSEALALSNIANDLFGHGGTTFTSKNATSSSEFSRGKAKFENIDILISALNTTDLASKSNSIKSIKGLKEFIDNLKDLKSDIEVGMEIIQDGDQNDKVKAIKLKPGAYEYKWKCVNCGDSTVSRFGHNGLEAVPNKR